MDIKLSQQVSATYARNNFKEVTNKAIKEGLCIIMKKSQPITVILPIEEYQKLNAMGEKPGRNKRKRKITIEELRKNSIFNEHMGSMKDFGNGLTSAEIAKKWIDYVD